MNQLLVMIVVSRRTESDACWRMIDAILTDRLLLDVSRDLLKRMQEGQAAGGVQAGVAAASYSDRFDGVATQREASR